MTTLPASIADLAQVPNVLLTPLNQPLQYQEVGLSLHTWMQAIGYTVVASSNGTVASAGNNVIVLADIVPGISGVDPHTWILYRSGNGVTEVLIDFDEQPAPFLDPQAADWYKAEAPFVGFVSTVNRPVAPPPYEYSFPVTQIVPWIGGLAGTLSYQYSANAEIGWLFVKLIGSTDTGFMSVVDQPDPADPMIDGGPPIGVVASNAAFGLSLFNTQTLALADMTGAALAPSFYANDGTIGIINATMADLQGRNNKLWMVGPGGSQPGSRFNGESRLFFTALQGAPFNGRTPGDPDPFTLWVLGNGTIYWLQAAGDIL